jgi:hypothetical protein
MCTIELLSVLSVFFQPLGKAKPVRAVQRLTSGLEHPCPSKDVKNDWLESVGSRVISRRIHCWGQQAIRPKQAPLPRAPRERRCRAWRPTCWRHGGPIGAKSRCAPSSISLLQCFARLMQSIRVVPRSAPQWWRKGFPSRNHFLPGCYSSMCMLWLARILRSIFWRFRGP